MKLIAGLGNPGVKYKNNRHNAGFIVLDAFAESKGVEWSFNKKVLAEVGVLKTDEVILLKPQTFMNSSGEAVAKALAYFGTHPSNLIVIHDDVDLEPLQFKITRNASSAGHHGVQDIIDKVGTQDFTRMRVGVGRPYILVDGVARATFDVEKYVLQDFTVDQLEVLRKQGIEHLLSSLKL